MADEMSERHVERLAGAQPNFEYRGPAHRAVAGRRDKRTKIELQDTLHDARKREETLLDRVAKITRREGALTELLGSGQDACNRIARLTTRERQVMALVLAGQPNKNIAADLDLSRRTIENHRAAMMKKMGVKSIAALARAALAAVWHRACETDSRIEIVATPTHAEAPQVAA
jgi:DNA-binding NarL/FixJ family response regulator